MRSASPVSNGWRGHVGGGGVAGQGQSSKAAKETLCTVGALSYKSVSWRRSVTIVWGAFGHISVDTGYQHHDTSLSLTPVSWLRSSPAGYLNEYWLTRSELDTLKDTISRFNKTFLLNLIQHRSRTLIEFFKTTNAKRQLQLHKTCRLVMFGPLLHIFPQPPLQKKKTFFSYWFLQFSSNPDSARQELKKIKRRCLKRSQWAQRSRTPWLRTKSSVGDLPPPLHTAWDGYLWKSLWWRERGLKPRALIRVKAALTRSGHTTDSCDSLKESWLVPVWSVLLAGVDCPANNNQAEVPLTLKGAVTASRRQEITAQVALNFLGYNSLSC